MTRVTLHRRLRRMILSWVEDVRFPARMVLRDDGRPRRWVGRFKVIAGATHCRLKGRG